MSALIRLEREQRVEAEGDGEAGTEAAQPLTQTEVTALKAAYDHLRSIAGRATAEALGKGGDGQ
jgi:hypothetical protein